MNAVEMITEKYINEEAKKLQTEILSKIDKALDDIHNARKNNDYLIKLGMTTEWEAMDTYEKIIVYRKDLLDFESFKKVDLVPIIAILEKIGIYHKH